MINLVGLDVKTMEDKLNPYISQKFRIKQIHQWIYQKQVSSFMEMSNLPQSLREELQDKFTIGDIRIKDKQVSKDGTTKFLLKFPDGALTEAVLMKYEHGLSICISTQVGCKMGCVFCSSGEQGFTRNLSNAEIVEQFWAIQRITKERIKNIVIMGMGEPLDNYDNVLEFIKFVNDETTFNIGIRNITLSTSGLVPQIYRLAEERLGITLALSLHAPNQQKRQKVMPISKSFPLKEVIDACRYYSDQTKRRLTIEYAMISDFNDSDKDAFELASLLSGLLCHINLIPLNDSSSDHELKKSSDERVKAFQKVLQKIGFKATIRRELGSDIDAACGQLKKRNN
ncbi:23S rRNA (adenine(2503)-C(2))-methyltransferase RlmN [Proteinivorax hydrogeniformans]|uniref:Probable dual-specificity RNA methyltransferase RlmN n=1 Tax=Proteinivorax hydrogeniformans TaxID=1826727 RepID=A0AAU8HR84_9FIRM